MKKIFRNPSLSIRYRCLFIFTVTFISQYCFADNNTLIKDTVNLVEGREVFKEHCVLCHGFEGKGDGRLSQLISDPPPFNLTQSTRPENYLKVIITHGGASLSRSEKMPAWKDELNEGQIELVISYILTLREKTE